MDLFLYLDPIEKRLHWKPYSKPLNHRERIPWASHHPKDVKKGTFIGEMSRLATLCSKLEHYRDAISDLSNLYLARGYPDDAVRSWVKAHFSQRWERRLGEPIVRDEVFVLKSHFNPAWSAFNVHGLSEVVVESWLSSLSKLDRANQSQDRTWHAAESTDGSELKIFRQTTLGQFQGGQSSLNPGESSPEGAAGRVGVANVAKPRVTYDPRDVMDVDELVALSEPSFSAHDLSVVWTDNALRVPKSLRVRYAMAEPRLDADPQVNPALHVPLGVGDQVGDFEPANDAGSVASGDDGTTDSKPYRICIEKKDAEIIQEDLDIRSVGFDDRAWLVSRRKIRNLGDIVNGWKKDIIQAALNSDSVQHMHVDEWQ